jgi:acyl-CoA synthetase (AMP-forming)/AMP-acid ligase II
MPEWLALFFAAARLGVLAVPVNTRSRAFELAQVLRTTRACGLPLAPDFLAAGSDATPLTKPTEVSLAALDHECRVGVNSYDEHTRLAPHDAGFLSFAQVSRVSSPSGGSADGAHRRSLGSARLWAASPR